MSLPAAYSLQPTASRSRWIRLGDGRGRDARVRLVARSTPVAPTFQTEDGRPARATRLIKSPLARAYAALRSRCADDAELARLLIEADPEIDLEAAGRRTGPTDRVLLDPDGHVLYATGQVEVLYDTQGREAERREPAASPANIDGPTPIVRTGKMLSRAEAVRRYAFTRAYQVRHVDGLTFDFLHAMAEELDRADSLVWVGAGPGGRDPLVLERNGHAYRGFLSGRVQDAHYQLVLHLSEMELREP